MTNLPDLANVPPLPDPSLYNFLQQARVRLQLLSEQMIGLFDVNAAAVRAAIQEGERKIAELQEIMETADADINAAVQSALDDLTAVHAQLVDIEQVANDAAAAVSIEAVARANADSAISAVVSTLSSTVGGHTASLTTQSAAIATVTGQVYSRWMINANANGHVTSMTLLSAAGPVATSAIVFKADAIMIEASSTTAVQPFYYDAVTGTLYTDTITVRNANIQNLTIAGSKLANNAVTAQASARNAGLTSVPIGASGWGIMAQAITTTGAASVVHISFSTYLNPQVAPALGASSPTQQTWVTLSLLRNGSTLFTDVVGVAFLSGGADEYHMAGGRFPITWSDTPGVGTHTYTVNIEVSGSAPHDAEFTGTNLNLVRFDK